MTKGTVGEDTTTDSPAYKVLEKPPSNWGDFKIQNLSFSLFRAIDRPVTWFRDSVVVPLQAKNKEKWYHRQYKRVPTVDQCEEEDVVCMFEAEQQYLRDKI